MLYQQAVDAERAAFGASHPVLATTLSNLAEMYRIQGQLEQAIDLHQEALAIREQALGADHPETAQSLNNLAVSHFDAGDYERAEELYRRSIAVKERIFGTDHPLRMMLQRRRPRCGRILIRTRLDFREP